ncbi:phage repressor protein [Staphylococcus warneri]|uniref:Phage repressor protein n=1 Tax=Staphylococcus warneri TaxID=1292 RepID=A0ABS9NES3_STAWA|nr:BRO family protein [Staphylococcus warneri]MCG6208979.1 phage repressor protein [Staphylococcus warneri]MCG6225251.1 phage repressor protein [Staphylococcus warneri]MCG6246116.1 phage repressor protein [Staphylococcus warneri]MCG6248491.1 phage repressor protein [Staphylococcus warneri]MCG6250862.1 phage repressor protein [Staphylococcus warneri]
MIKHLFNNKEIRFIEKDNEYWAVAGDVAKVLGYRDAPSMTRNIDNDDITTHIMRSNKKGNPNKTIVSEYGIYEAIWNSRRDEAIEFKKWVKQVIKELRQSTGLKGYEAFRMLDKEKQKEAMDNLKNGIKAISKKDYCKAQSISNKAVSNVYGFPKMVQKGDMTQEMLELRQQVLNDTVEFMVFVDKYNLPLSVKKHIYDKYNNKQQMA